MFEFVHVPSDHQGTLGTSQAAYCNLGLAQSGMGWIGVQMLDQHPVQHCWTAEFQGISVMLLHFALGKLWARES